MTAGTLDATGMAPERTVSDQAGRTGRRGTFTDRADA